eukprot:233557_1
MQRLSTTVPTHRILYIHQSRRMEDWDSYHKKVFKDCNVDVHINYQSLGAIIGLGVFSGAQSGWFGDSELNFDDHWAVGPFCHYISDVIPVSAVTIPGKQRTFKIPKDIHELIIDKDTEVRDWITNMRTMYSVWSDEDGVPMAISVRPPMAEYIVAGIKQCDCHSCTVQGFDRLSYQTNG